jgi:dipeptidyl aminopeptidase/acylaminoacyl peptidase
VLFWLGVLLMVSVPLVVLGALVFLSFYVRYKYMHRVPRIFVEKPVFIVPRGEPIPEAESVRFPTSDGLTLQGCYLKGATPRRGVILFGLEFGSNCWSCLPYVEHLLAAGFDVFAFEPRNQGTSDAMPGYEPLQWLTEYEVEDTRAAVRYLRSRPDADPRGVGFFGISKGGNAGLFVASTDPYIRCCVTDGAFGTYLTVVPYMRHWMRIYSARYTLQSLAPSIYYEWFARSVLRIVERERHVRYSIVEWTLSRLAPRPLLMIHGGEDSYIRPDMARALFERAREPREFWLVPGARHNQAMQLAEAEYRQRVLTFFETHLS